MVLAEIFQIAYETLQSSLVGAGITLAKVLLLLLAGILAGKILGAFVKKAFNAFKLKDALASINAEPTFLGIDLADGVKLFVEWYTYLYFLMEAMLVMSVPALATFIEEIKTLSVFFVKALLVAYVGLQLANHLRNGLRKHSKTPQLADLVYYIVLYLTMILALTSVYPQAANLMNYLLLILVASVGLGLSLGLGISLGLGTKDVIGKVAKRYIAKK